jgi:hypothetical protein
MVYSGAPESLAKKLTKTKLAKIYIENILFENVSFENDKNSKLFLLVQNIFLTLKDLSSKFIY